MCVRYIQLSVACQNLPPTLPQDIQDGAAPLHLNFFFFFFFFFTVVSKRVPEVPRIQQFPLNVAFMLLKLLKQGK